MSGTDVGPGMCLIDRWMRLKLKKNYDNDGKIAKSGKINTKILKKLLKNFYKKEKKLNKGPVQSFDTKYFDFSFVENLSLKDGAATLTEFTVKIIISALRKRKHNKSKIILCGGGRKNNFLVENLSLEDGAATLTEFTNKIIISAIKTENRYKEKIILCGGGRNNSYLVEKLKREIKGIRLIDQYGVDGDFVESQAFAYLAIRSYLHLPISFPETTGVSKSCTGGIIIKN